MSIDTIFFLCRVPEELPHQIEQLRQDCMEVDPKLRPTAKQLYETMANIWQLQFLGSDKLPVLVFSQICASTLMHSKVSYGQLICGSTCSAFARCASLSHTPSNWRMRICGMRFLYQSQTKLVFVSHPTLNILPFCTWFCNIRSSWQDDRSMNPRILPIEVAMPLRRLWQMAANQVPSELLLIYFTTHTKLTVNWISLDLHVTLTPRPLAWKSARFRRQRRRTLLFADSNRLFDLASMLGLSWHCYHQKWAPFLFQLAELHVSGNWQSWSSDLFVASFAIHVLIVLGNVAHIASASSRMHLDDVLAIQ